MPTNARQYWPIAAIGFATPGTPLPTGVTGAAAVTGYTAAKGVQSVGINTTFNLESVFELGQLELYEYRERVPDIEVTIEKDIDGYALLEHLSTPTATTPTLAGRYNDGRCQIAMGLWNISLDFASGVPLSTVVMSGMYLSSINFNIPVQGPARESVSFVGSDKTWNYAPSGIFTSSSRFQNHETTVTASGGVSMRENIIMASSLWPKALPGIDVGGVNQPNGASGYSCHIQNVTISANLGRTSLYELGTRGPYFRYANFPVEVTTNIELTASELGDDVAAAVNANNLTAESIRVWLQQGVIIDLGSTNKLKNVTMNGAGTDGGNMTVTYAYSNFNVCKVNSPSDPANLTY